MRSSSGSYSGTSPVRSTAVGWVLPLGQAIAFMAVHRGVFGLYLGLAFAPNHKGMPLLSKADALDHLRAQVLTARNVRGGLVVDAALGGLNYQIEHHLFPSTPGAICAAPSRSCGRFASAAECLT